MDENYQNMEKETCPGTKSTTGPKHDKPSGLTKNIS